MNQPLVSIVVISHNHGPYIRDAIVSAYDQTYPSVEVIVVDDSSQDQSVTTINNMKQEGFKFSKRLLTGNVGYCKAFNLGLSLASGEYIIDLAADDMLLSSRVEKGVYGLESSNAGVDYCDVYYIDESSMVQGTHFDRDSNGELLSQVYQGDIFRHILEKYFICAPGMMIRKEVLDSLGGYDEQLYYEDFDFWVRSSRCYNYHYTDEILVKKRVLDGSMSKSQYLPESKMLPTTAKVCQKAFKLCQSEEEYRSLGKRIRYELRQAVLSNNYSVALEMHNLLGKIESSSTSYWIWAWLIDRGWDFSFLTPFMRKAR